MEKRKLQKEFMRQQIKRRGALKGLATEEGYESFVVPDDVGGRFSVLTAVGLLPIAVSGADIDEVNGRRCIGKRSLHWSKPFEENDALKYAAIRNILTPQRKIGRSSGEL